MVISSETAANAPMDGLLGPGKFLDIAFQFAAAKAFMTAVELGVFSALEEHGPMSAEQLRDAVGLHPRVRADLFDLLVSQAALERDADGLYRNTPEGAAFLDKSKDTYIGGLLGMMNTRLYDGVFTPSWHINFSQALRLRTIYIINDQTQLNITLPHGHRTAPFVTYLNACSGPCPV